MIREIRLADGSGAQGAGHRAEAVGDARRSRGGGPALGEHTDEVLREIDYDAATIAALRARGVVA